MSEQSIIKYNWIPEVETLSSYRPGGYHPVMIGDILHDRYVIADKLGFGGYSTVWLARDTHQNQYVALKINMSSTHTREAQILRAVAAPTKVPLATTSGVSWIPQFLDEFFVEGPNGKHSCYAVNPARSDLRETSFSRLFSLEVSHAIAYELVLAVAYLHSRGVVHGDIHLGNVLVRPPSDFDNLSIDELHAEYGEPETVPITRCDGEPLPPNCPAEAVVPLYLGKHAADFDLNDAKITLSDFGEAFSPDTEERLGKDCHTPLPFRAPEARFEPDKPLAASSDIWSLATALWEIIGMKAVFSTDFVSPDEIIAQHNDVLGPMPKEWLEKWQARPEFFDDSGAPTEGYRRKQWSTLDESLETSIQQYRREDGNEMGPGEARAFIELMRWMLSYRPSDRPTAEQVLGSEWLSKWARPDLMKPGKKLGGIARSSTNKMEFDDPDEYDITFPRRQIAWQLGSEVIQVQPTLILKKGAKVRPSEMAAMNLIHKHAPSIPVPSIEGYDFRYRDGDAYYGELLMDYIPGETLMTAWAKLDDQGKGRICQNIWDIVATMRSSVPRPEDLAPGLYRTVDGHPSYDPLLGDNNDVAPREMDDETLRTRIWRRYVATNGLSYKDGASVKDELPHSDKSVFTHGDLAPRNIMVDDAGRITAVLDWEYAGWYPDYWEYMQMMKFCDPLEYEWQRWMTQTKPEPWDISAFRKAWRVLF
ncbi:protein kinase domain protein [Cordyceps militaris CM01]|uniref:non-specific serine/threonine protein kinase n=1 Tax=Cordyceps militaris (strain CM01) TaxID=983644 RepID=G3JU65_CORMM|nr:protein kinase domain protein [Cordyceps militaris CM01]EGX87893.1 protein kinase domain protein [Cordyceps militaris CM01]